VRHSFQIAKSCAVPDTRKRYWAKFVWCQVVVTIHDGNGGPDLGDVGDGVETGAALPRDESGPDFTSISVSPEAGQPAQIWRAKAPM